jgi:four helix bundle protein
LQIGEAPRAGQGKYCYFGMSTGRSICSNVAVLCGRLPRTAPVLAITKQLLDSAGSTDSNYRAACRARSPKEFIAKIGIAAEEADESLGWLQSLRHAQLADGEDLLALIREADELTAIFVASRKTAVSRYDAGKKRPKPPA